MKASLSDRFWKLNLKLAKNEVMQEEFNYAAITGKLWRLDYLINNKKIDIGFEDNLAIRWAANGGFNDVIDFLILHGADIHAKEDDAIVKAAGNGQIKTVEKLLKMGLKINTQDGEALILAAGNDKDVMVRFLINNGIDLNKFGDKAYKKAIEKNSQKTADLIRKAIHNKNKKLTQFGN